MSAGAQTVTVKPDDAELRLDRWFKRHYPTLSHGRLEKLLRTGQIRVDGRRAKAGLRLAPGQAVRIPPLAEDGMGPGSNRAATDSAESGSPKRHRPLTAEDAALAAGMVIYRDDDVLALNKPPGLAVQGGTGTERHLDAMLDGLRFDAAERPRLVHRLDKDTSGVLLLGRSAWSAARLAAAFRDKTTRKIYWALVVGVPRPFQGRIDLPIAKLPGRAGERMAPDAATGKHAVTYYAVIEHMGRKAAWLALWPVTGRTHQLRVHLAAIGTPILGDGKYGGPAAQLAGDGLSRKLHLHARRLSLPHPRTGRPLTIEAPLPAHMRASWRLFGFDPEAPGDPFESLEP